MLFRSKRAVGQGPFGRGINVPDIVLDSQAKERSTISDPVSGQVSDMQCSPLCIRESVERGHDRGSKRRADMLSNSDICPSKQAASLEDCDNRNNQNPHSVGRQKKKTRTDFDFDIDSDNGITSLLSMLILQNLIPFDLVAFCFTDGTDQESDNGVDGADHLDSCSNDEDSCAQEVRNAEKMLDEELRPTLDRLRARSRDSAGASAFIFQSSTLKPQIL